MDLLLFFGPTGMSPLALLVILVIALLMFGKRLPEVARSLGKGIVEFKKGVKGIEEDVNQPLPPPSQPYYGQNQYPYGGQQQAPYSGQYGAPPQQPGYTPPPPAASDPSQAYAQQYGAPYAQPPAQPAQPAQAAQPAQQPASPVEPQQKPLD